MNGLRLKTGWAILLLVLFLLLISSLLYFGAAHAVVYDHNDTDITGLTLSEINHAKSNLHIAYGHMTFGSQITTGMTGLVGFANGGGLGLSHPTDTFAWNNGGTGGALDLHDYAMGGAVGYYPDWVNNTINYLGAVDPLTGRGTSHSDVNVIMWAWDLQVDTTDLLNHYFNPMAALETEYFGVTFVYMTGPLEGGGIGSSVNIANEQIRDFCIANDKILYDFADIESYDPDGLINYMELGANGACDYDGDGNGTLESNWAINWQSTHTDGVDWYSCPSGHSQPLNANLKAYAAWNMFVDISSGLGGATVTTLAVSSITALAATGNGNITSLGAGNPTAHGVCWNTGGNPTTADSLTNEGGTGSTGAFTSNITGLSESTTYYVRAYATNVDGTAYGNQVIFTTTAMSATIPALNEWGIIIFTLLICITSVVVLQERNYNRI